MTDITKTTYNQPSLENNMIALTLLLMLNTFLLWRIYNLLLFISTTPTSEDLWDIFSEYLAREEPEEGF